MGTRSICRQALPTWPRLRPYDDQAFAWGTRGLALQCHAAVTAHGLERWFIGHAHEIEHTPGLSLGQLRQDTQCYAPRLQVRPASCWQTWLNEVIDGGEGDRRSPRFATGEYCYGFDRNASLV